MKKEWKNNKTKEQNFIIGLNVRLEDGTWDEAVSFSGLLEAEHMKKVILRWLDRAGDAIILEKREA